MTAPATGVAPSRGFVVTVSVATAALLAVAVFGFAVNAAAPASSDLPCPAQLMLDAAPFWFLLVGGFLVIRRPRNATAWVLWLLAVGIMAGSLSQGAMNLYSAGHAVPRGLVAWADWVDNTTWILWFLGIFELLLRFPDGRLPGRRWRALQVLAATDATVCFVVCAVLPQDPDYPQVANPLHLGPLNRIPTGVANVVIMVAFVLMIAAVGAAVVGIGLRFRRAVGVERAQLKWLLSGAGFAVAVLVLELLLEAIYGGTGGIPEWVKVAVNVLAEASLWTLPLAVAVAVLRHGLFEIDRLVSRTVSYAVVVALLAGAYAGVVAGVSALVPERFGSVAVVLATLAVSALFLPVRRRVIGVVDRRFNRSRYDSAAVVAEFADLVRGRAGTGAATGPELVAAAHRALQPAHATVWLAPRGDA